MLYQILVYNIHRKILKNHIRIIDLKISAPTCNKEFELPAGSHSISDIQDYSEYILKRHRGKTVNYSIRVYTNKIENRIMFKIKTGYYLELLTLDTIRLLGSTKSKIAKN